jgi:hypothetical protein
MIVPCPRPAVPAGLLDRMIDIIDRVTSADTLDIENDLNGEFDALINDRLDRVQACMEELREYRAAWWRSPARDDRFQFARVFFLNTCVVVMVAAALLFAAVHK